jgi:hypothetical protein
MDYKQKNKAKKNEMKWTRNTWSFWREDTQAKLIWTNKVTTLGE